MSKMNYQSNEMSELITKRAYQKQLKRRKMIQSRRQKYISIVFLLFVVLFCTGTVSEKHTTSLVSVKILDSNMMEGETLPEQDVEVKLVGKKDTILETDQNYTIQDLMMELENSIGLEYECDADGKEDGTFVIDGHLSKSLESKLLGTWFGKVKIHITDGKLTVKDKTGRWKEDIFIGWDENPIKNTWISNGGKQVLLNEEGKATVGTKQVGIIKYEFNEQGEMLSRETYIDPEKPMIAITMDDGPGPYTNEVLDILEENGAHGTFFMQGINVTDKYAAVLKRMADLGCELGNHSTKHDNLKKLTAEQIRKDMKNTNERIKKYCGKYPTVMRPPYGAVDEKVLQNVGLPVILWNVDTLDWKTRNTNQTVKSLTTNIKSGDILLLHDIHKPSVEALKIAIPQLIEQGYQLVTVSEMKEIQGGKLESGSKYYSIP